MLVLRRARRARVQVELLARDGCHLCEDALRAVESVFGPANVRATDVTLDRQLEDEFVLRIPVLRFGPHVLAEGVITRADARKARQRALQLAQTREPRQ